MKIVVGLPPNFDEIDRVFKVRGREVFYCYGPVIYNPTGVTIAPTLIVHEKVHCERQGSDPEDWWRRYLADSRFRFDEELPAHRAEYRAVCQETTHKGARAHALWKIAARLSGPLYGGIIKYSDAKAQILK
jgi:hypothetical protein